MNRIDRLEIHGLEVATPWGPARIARAVLAGVSAAAGPGEATVEEIRLEGATVEIDLAATVAAPAGEPWRCAPADGTGGELRAYITDAAWVLDADVTIPIERGRIDFNRATVEHIGPDSALALGRAGLHVDAPNGRTTLWVWPGGAPVPGAHYEQRGALLSQLTDRGALDLRPFVEALLAGMALGAPAAGARELLARTRLGGHLRLGDGLVGNAQQRVQLTGQQEGRNRIELSSMPSGQGFGLHLVELAAADLHVEFAGRVATAAALGGTVALHLKDPAGKPSIAARAADLTLRGVAVRPAQRAAA